MGFSELLQVGAPSYGLIRFFNKSISNMADNINEHESSTLLAKMYRHIPEKQHNIDDSL